jgi:hypothetical protein
LCRYHVELNIETKERWHSQQSGFNCFAFSRRTMPGLPEIRMNPSPQTKRRVTLPSKSVDMTCPMVALVSDAAHRAPDNPLRVSGSQQDRALPPVFATRTGARRFVARQAFGSAGRQGLGVDQAHPTHRRRIQIRNLCQRMSRAPHHPCVVFVGHPDQKILRGHGGLPLSLFFCWAGRHAPLGSHDTSPGRTDPYRKSACAS